MFEFQTLRPYRSTKLDYAEISHGLKRAGLTCKDNDPKVIKGVATDIISAFPTHGPRFFIAAPEGDAKEYEYEVDPLNPHLSKMQVLLKNLSRVKQIYAVDHHEKQNDFESTALGTIKNVFTEVGKMIGNVQGGHVDPEQIGSQIGDVLSSLTESESRNFHEEREGFAFLVGGVEGTKAKAIMGLYYFYEFTVNDYKDKKVEQHKTHYEVIQDNMLFTDLSVFEDIYQKING